MTSISMPPPFHSSPFDSHLEITTRPNSSYHSRKHSRNPNTTPLPSFSFNPGSFLPSEESVNAAEPIPEAMAPQDAPKRAPRPPPLPDFKFNPGSVITPDLTPSPTHPILEEMALNQQRNSRSARPAPLAAFTFAPGSGGQPSPSPTRLSFGEAAGPARSGGHRRRGSEFVGGGAEGSQLISTSPQKGDSRPLGPPVSGFGHRGHVHRRSQAISISDIDTSDLIKANAVSKHRAGSTPTTPSDPSQSLAFSHNSPQMRQSMSNLPGSPSASPRRRGSAPGVRPRVGFSDHIDVIPRPLSLISSETEGSNSTIRGGHSVSGSINSIAASPTPRLISPVAVNFNESPRRRPQTADAASFMQNGGSGKMAVASLPKRPLSASGSPACANSGSPPLKKKSWFGHSAESSPTPTPKAEHSDPMSDVSSFLPSDVADNARPRTSPERASSIKRRKVRSWTNGIFSRKARHRSNKSKAPKRTPTPPLTNRQASDQMNDIFDADDTIVIRNPSPVHQNSTAPFQPSLATTLPPIQYVEPKGNVTSPIIDLDAALGPFGSEEKLSPDGGSRRLSKIAKLHSSERRGMNDAFGTFHRRTESAPQMPAVNRGTFGTHHLGSNTSLVGDVFDEEEEDNYLAGEDAEEGSITSSAHNDSHRMTGTTPEPEEDHFKEAENQRSGSLEGLGVSIPGSVSDAVMIVGSDDGHGPDMNRASNSTIEAPILADTDLHKQPASSPMSFGYPSTQTHYASSTEGRTTTNSVISSPDADHTSFNQQPPFSRFLSEPSPETGRRVSTDDLPSLTDSISTGAVPRFSSSANTRSSVEQRSASVSGPVTSKSSNAWKRASLASLNRLIPGSSNGSRLKFESTLDPAEEEKTKKKGNRISKLMHFWRSKEKGEKSSKRDTNEMS